ncbi:MAG: 4Fe-4S dicluster domain-containing protein [Candidatus Desantisbacteria bacterium]
MAVKYGMLIDLRRCTGCRACQVACKAENEVPLGIFRGWVTDTERGTYPKVKKYFLPRLCNHCDKPVCMEKCPIKAISKRADGVVLVDQSKCKNLKLCVKNCPYGAPSINPMVNKAEKCTFCIHRVEAGIVPSCVNTCQGRARIFGDVNDSASEIAKLIAAYKTTTLTPHTGGPNVYYIAPDQKEVGYGDEYQSMNKSHSGVK